MVVSVRAGLTACVGVIALAFAAAPPAASAQTIAAPALAPAPFTGATLQAPTTETAIDLAPTYFVLQDRDQSEAETAIDETDVVDPVVEADVAPSADSAEISADERCLAAAVYYESRGEPLAGQYAVAHVILNRVRSGRFADTPCGVVRQHGQFSFVHRSFTPRASRDWRRAVAVARSALAGEGHASARGAMYFHASYVAPGWNRSEIAVIGHHIFYR